MWLTSDETTCVCVCVRVVLVIAALVLAMIDFADCGLGGLGWSSGRVDARGTTTGTATTRLRMLAACVGRFRRRTSAWTQTVRCRALDIWLRWRVFDGCFDGLRGASRWRWRPRCCGTGGARGGGGSLVVVVVVVVVVAAWCWARERGGQRCVAAAFRVAVALVVRRRVRYG